MNSHCYVTRDQKLDKYLTVILATLTALVFLSGYSYLSGYYGYYDIEVSELAPTIEQILSHSYVVCIEVLRTRYLMLLLVVAVFVMYVLSQNERNFSKVFFTGVPLSAALFGILVVLNANSIGQKFARENYAQMNIFRPDEKFQSLLVEVFGEADTVTWHHLVSTESLTILVGNFDNGRSNDRWIVRVFHDTLIAVAAYQDPV